jgi:hypothetical protein
VAFISSSDYLDGENGTAVVGWGGSETETVGPTVFLQNGGDFSQVTAMTWGSQGGSLRFIAIFSAGPVLAGQVQQPINADGSSTFKANRGVVPVKFTLTADGQRTCELPPATICVTRVGGTMPGPIDEATYSMAADNGSNFRIDDCQYVYNLAAKSLGSGTYLVEIKIDGQVVGEATFELK